MNQIKIDLNSLNLELKKYEIQKESLPKDSYLETGRNSANLQPFLVWGPAPENLESFRQLNWTNLFLWNKLGDSKISLTSIFLKQQALEEKINNLEKHKKR